MLRNGGSVGFWHQGALGDFVLFSPVLDALHELWPRTIFTLWTRPAYGDLLAGKPYTVTVYSADGPFWSGLFTEEAWQTEPVPEALSQGQAFFWVGQKCAKTAVERLQKRLPGKVFWIQSFPEDEVQEPVTRFLFKQLEVLGFPVAERKPKIFEDPSLRAQAAPWVASEGLPWGHYGVVHMGSGGLRKVWPVARWQSLFEATSGFFKRPMVMLSGPADEKIFPFVEEFSRVRGWRVIHTQEIKRLTAVLSGAAFYVGCDSGVSHVAAAMEVPSLVIFGPTNPVVWAPQGTHVRIYQDCWDPQDVLRRQEDGARKVDSDLLRRVAEVLGV